MITLNDERTVKPFHASLITREGALLVVNVQGIAVHVFLA